MIAGALLLACSGSSPPGETPPVPAPTPPASPLVFDGPVPTQLIMISIDTLRVDQLAAFGGAGDRPFLDGLVEQGVLLHDHMGCSNWTYHATTCTVRGADPLSWGFAPALMEMGGIERDLPPGLDFLSAWLGDAGYHTMLGTTNALFSEVHGNGVGYDAYMLAPELGATPAEIAGNQTLGMLDAALAAGHERWFWHLHLMEPHRPYDPPEAYRTSWDELPPIPYDLDKLSDHDQAVYDALTVLTEDEIADLELHMRTRYASDVRWLDDQLVGIWAELEARGVLDDALVVIWSDHGEQHFERGYQTHAFTLYREENDAVALFWAKNLRPAQWEGPTHATDIVPTVLQLLGVPIPDVVTGVPLGEADPERARFAFTAAKVGVFQAVRQGSDKLHFSWADAEDLEVWQRFAQGIHQYDLDSDPGELVDLWDPESQRSQELWSLLEPQVRAASALLPERSVRYPY